MCIKLFIPPVERCSASLLAFLIDCGVGLCAGAALLYNTPVLVGRRGWERTLGGLLVVVYPTLTAYLFRERANRSYPLFEVPPASTRVPRHTSVPKNTKARRTSFPGHCLGVSCGRQQ